MSLIWCGLYVAWVQTGEFDLRPIAPELHEASARRSFARISAGRLGSMANADLAGVVVPSAICKVSRFVYGDLSAWCEKVGWAVATDSDNANVILKKKSHNVVVALGSASINFGPIVYPLPVPPKTYAGVPFTRRQRVTTDWMTASGVVMEKDGRVMVPKDVLDRVNSIELIRFR